MEHARIDISKDLDDQPVVHAVFDLTPDEIAAAAPGCARRRRFFRMEAISADDVVELRELTVAGRRAQRADVRRQHVDAEAGSPLGAARYPPSSSSSREDSDWIR